ncbi:hypothetical protein FPRO04_13211 [Fusarium proliferatum]|nr:hypothetical protein FPRO04_13211 [Fusarium proliferatum]
MLLDATIDSAAERLAEFRNNNALNDILDQYAVLIEDYKRLKSDYEEEREGRERYKQLARGQERNPFALVVVDGDGYIFDERFVKDGEEGGSRAAKQLNDSIKDSLRRKGLESCEVMVRIYANLTGLSKALCKNGLAGAEKRSFSSFTAGFNRSYGLADFIDAGKLKENADFKVKAILRLYADNAQCKHIYFAACHDVGYVSDLIPFRGNRERFTLIRTPSVLFHKEFDRLAKTSLASSNKMSKAINTPYTNSTIKTDDKNSVCSFYAQGNCRYSSGCKLSHVDSKTSSQNSTPSPSTIGSSTKNLTGDWRCGPSITKSNIESLPRKDDIPDGHMAINAVEDRLDAYLTPPDPEAARRLKTLSQEKRFSNNAQLYNSCESDNCGYEHAPIDKELLPALEHLSRSVPFDQPMMSPSLRSEDVDGHNAENGGTNLWGDQLVADQIRPFRTRDILWLTINDLAIVNFYRQNDEGDPLGTLLRWPVPMGQTLDRGQEIAGWASENDLDLRNTLDITTNPHGNTIDLAFTNMPLAEATVEDHLATSSDHFTLSLTLPDINPAPIQPGKIQVTTEDELKRFVEIVELGATDIPLADSTPVELNNLRLHL